MNEILPDDKQLKDQWDHKAKKNWKQEKVEKQINKMEKLTKDGGEYFADDWGKTGPVSKGDKLLGSSKEKVLKVRVCKDFPL